MLQPQSWGEEYSLHTSTSVVGEFARREFAFRLSSTANVPRPKSLCARGEAGKSRCVVWFP
jgi:hypothetical protein